MLQHPKDKGNIINDWKFFTAESVVIPEKKKAQQSQQPNTHELHISEHKMEEM